MNELFEPPISTSNLCEPDLQSLCAIFQTAFDETAQLQTGKLVRELEARLCSYHEAKHCVAFSTGFWALVAAIRLKAIASRDEVIIPSMTYRRLADVIFWAGKIPVFVDVEPGNLSICPNAVEANISDKTALILGVHPIVNCCDVQRLICVANDQNIPIVFDAVESVHESFCGRRIGSFGVGEVFSFHASKLINGAEGGYVCTDDASLYASLLQFRGNQLLRDSVASQMPNARSLLSINGVMNDVHAAYALVGLDEISRNVSHNKLLYEAYLSELENVAGIDVLPFDSNEQTSFKNVVAKISDLFPLSRDELVVDLNQRGILARAHYSPALHTRQYQFSVRTTSMDVTNIVMNQFINLPCGSRVSENDVIITCQYLDSLTKR